MCFERIYFGRMAGGWQQLQARRIFSAERQPHGLGKRPWTRKQSRDLVRRGGLEFRPVLSALLNRFSERRSFFIPNCRSGVKGRAQPTDIRRLDEEKEPHALSGPIATSEPSAEKSSPNQKRPALPLGSRASAMKVPGAQRQKESAARGVRRRPSATRPAKTWSCYGLRREW